MSTLSIKTLLILCLDKAASTTFSFVNVLLNYAFVIKHF